MRKNIILCSDGTGNSGDYGNHTNVFKLYKAVDTKSPLQQALYDDGIGTGSFPYFKQVAAAFGIGFDSNILNLYTYLVRHYQPGDNIYLFGFSRGAATVRALVDMINTVGLIRSDYDGVMSRGHLDDIAVTIQSIKALRLYKKRNKKEEEIKKFRYKTHDTVGIKMIGVWDTVSSLGVPKDSSVLIIGLSIIIDKFINYFSPHNYFEYQLDNNVSNAYQALAIDDERYTFHPQIWDETTERGPRNIEQVWFPGVHSNVGGGYARSGLSDITLDWMMTKAEQHGVKFDKDIWDDVKRGCNPGGKLYDSRRGVKSYYRYAPRHIRDLSSKNGKSIINGNIKIHESVFDRINLVSYAPILPNKFDIVNSNNIRYNKTYVESEDEILKLKGRANNLYKIRTGLYHAYTELSVFTAILMWYFSAGDFNVETSSRVYNFILSILPNFSHNLIHYLLFENRILGVLILSGFVLIPIAKKISKILTTKITKRINWNLLGL